MAISTHKSDVIRINKIEKHPNADSLGIVKIFDGFVCCVRLGDFQEGDLAVYIQPDSICPDTDLFAFLGEHKRIKVKKLRGIFSMGLLIKAPEGLNEGDDASEILGITHYNPPEPNLSTGAVSAPSPLGFYPHYDVESFRKYGRIFEEGEKVFCTEKIHGCNGKFVYKDNEFHCGSRTRWTADEKGNVWWKALRKHDEIQKFLQDNPGVTVYGEVYGNVQELKYGHAPGDISFILFDILKEGMWINAPDFFEVCQKNNLPHVPIVYEGPFNFEKCLELAEGNSLIPNANHIREGVVIKPETERWNSLVEGRVSLKVVGNGYLEKVKNV